MMKTMMKRSTMQRTKPIFPTILLIALLATATACGQEHDFAHLQNESIGIAVDADIDTIATKAGSDFVVERTDGVDPRYEALIRKIVAEGEFTEEFVRPLFADNNTVYIPKMVAIRPRLKKKTYSGSYAWVNTTESAEKCVDFLTTHREIFDEVERKYKVDRETIAALLRVETQHGTITGDYHVLSCYASLALMPEKWAIADNVAEAERAFKEAGKGNSATKKETSRIRKRSVSRGGWAYKQLKHVLRIHKSGTLDVRPLYGSWAGAFGWPQFIPSSYRSLAVDGNGDGTIDLYHAADAIHSVGYYLSQSGYRSGKKSRIIKSLKRYNNSSAYANSIYALSRRVISTPSTGS